MVHKSVNSCFNILILGGTGAIGEYLTNEYLNSGYHVYVTSRRHYKTSKDRLKYLLGDAQELTKIAEWLNEREYHAVIDLMVYSTAIFKDRLDLLSEFSFQYIFVSSYRIFADSKLAKITEHSNRLLDVCDDNEYLKLDDYALSKARQEDALRGSNVKNWTIVRPSISYSANRFQLGTLEADMFICRAKQGLPIILPREIMDIYTTMTWAGDVAKMISKLTLDKSALRTDFNLVTNESVKWKDVAQIYEQHLGLKIVEVSLKEYEMLGLNKWQLKYDRMLNRLCDNNKVLSATGLKNESFMSIEDGLKKEILSSQSKFDSYSSFTIYTGRMDRILNIWQIPPIRKPKEFIRYMIGRFSFFDYFYRKL